MICFSICALKPYDQRSTCKYCGKCEHLCSKHPEHRFDNSSSKWPWEYEKIDGLTKREKLVDRSIPGRK